MFVPRHVIERYFLNNKRLVMCMMYRVHTVIIKDNKYIISNKK